MTCQPTGKLGFTNLFREKNWRELWTRDEYQKAGKKQGKEYEYDKNEEGKWEGRVVPYSLYAKEKQWGEEVWPETGSKRCKVAGASAEDTLGPLSPDSFHPFSFVSTSTSY
ncbi:hypothetical protein HZH66_003458 [Vespula vulgaris]|uniref:Uncharacterized protein n=1 Tax=Vespula vulgaris TaxID=7454 RepID=A0A834NCV4_VESVU|nr:hypothetical protein HZH66_003458 [Vespula vulgaris]